MEVIEQSTEDTYNLMDNGFIASNNFEIYSCASPQISYVSDFGRIFVNGHNNKTNHLSCRDFDSKIEAQNFIKNACQAITEYNNKFNNNYIYKDDEENDPNIKITIAE